MVLVSPHIRALHWLVVACFAVACGKSDASSGGPAGASGGAGGSMVASGGSGAEADSAGTATAGTSVAGAMDGGGSAGESGAGAMGGTAGTGAAGAIYSGLPWLDTDGNLVNAHGVGFIQVGDTYYMVGEQRSGANDTYSGAPINAEDTFTGVSMYSTKDFVNWTFVGTVVKPTPGTVAAPPYYGERPKILHNATTGQYVIYIKMLNYTGTPPLYTGQYAVFTSSDIAGPYSYHGTLSLSGANDFQVFQDDDGAQYFARDGGILYRLSADSLSIADYVKDGIQSGEGTSLYKAGNTYFWQSSQGTYWYSNDNSYSTATALTGPWTPHGLFCPSGSKTWQSQDTAVITIQGSAGRTYIYVGDRWVNGDLPASTLVMQPLTVSGDRESIPTYYPVWDLNVAAGTWSAVDPVGTSVNDATIGSGENQFVYDSDWTVTPMAGAYGGDLHSSAVTGATASIPFNGRQILLYSAHNGASGIVGVSLSDSNGQPLGPELHVSLRYDSPAAGNYLVYASPVLPSAPYVLKVRVTGLKDRYSTGMSGNIDRVLVIP